jgi:predicted dehydrogenase
MGYAGSVRGFEIAAVCDVRQSALDHAAAQARKLGLAGVQATKDFRAVLADESIDAVCISTPDQWHAGMAVEACQAGKDVWVETPACVCVQEGVEMVRAARRYKRVVQAGTTARSGGLFRKVRAMVKGGELGEIGFCRVAEAGIEQQLHPMDMLQGAFDEAMPVTISAQAGTSGAMLATYRYPGFVASYERRGVSAASSVSFHGSRATLMVDGAGWRLFPNGWNAKERGGPSADGNAPHWRDFLECIRARRRPASDIETCVRTSTTCLLSTMALRHGVTLDWDEQAFTVKQGENPAILESKISFPLEIGG